MICLNCKKETSNPKFCSRSCSATYSNKNNPKRKPKIQVCSKCGSELKTTRYKGQGRLSHRSLCGSCLELKYDWSKVSKKSVNSIRNYQINSRIRGLARTIYLKSGLPKSCFVCGYDKHFEVCHIKAISSFSEETTISEINSLENLVALCPNHHWELDNRKHVALSNCATGT